MARDTGGGQQHTQPSHSDDGEAEETAAAEAAEERKEHQDALGDDVDTILDEIDEVLEENAEDFVRAFVQKGGE